MPPLPLLMETLPTPIGDMLILTDAEGLLRVVDWHDHADRMTRLLLTRYGAGGVAIQPRGGRSGAARTIEAYFAGDLAALDSIAVATTGTPFQQAVWRALRTLPAGTTTTYSALAALAGRPKAIRAAGHANGANPIGVVVPCHRIIGTDGTLTGYGGGLHRKRWLLAHEGVEIR
jgi:methylated-DNA-[protein]-cysteine S-methyltransferase